MTTSLQARATQPSADGSELRVLQDGRRIRGFADAGYGSVLGGYGDARARGLTVALRTALLG